MSSTAQAPTANLATSASDPITLRVNSSTDSPFDRNFVNDKFTIGSSARCDLHLSQPGVQPLHCVLVRKPNGIQLTSWAAGVLLNGNPVQTAAFHAGDVVRVGEVQIAWENATESIEDSLRDIESSLEAATSPEFAAEDNPVDWGFSANTEKEPDLCPTPTGLTPEVAKRQAFSDWLVYQTTIEKQSTRRRCKQLLRSCRESRSSASRLTEQINQLEQRLAEVSQERLAAQAGAEQLATQGSEDSSAEDQQTKELVESLESELAAIRLELATTRDELATQTKLCDASQAELEQLHLEHDELSTAIADQSLTQEGASDLLAERDLQLEEVRSELANTRNELATAEEQLASQVERYDYLESELHNRCEEIANLTQRFTAATEKTEESVELSDRCGLLQAALDAAEKRISDLSQLNLERASELEQLRAAREAWAQEKADWQQEQLTSPEALAALTEQVEAAQGRDEDAIAELTSQRDQLQEELATVKSALEDLTASVTQREATISALEEQQHHWQTEKSLLEVDLADKSKAVLELKNDLEARGPVDDSRSEELIAERDQLTAELAIANQSLAELRELSAEQHVQLETLTQQVSDASQAEAPGISEERFAEVTTRLESLAGELEATRTRCTEAESRADELQSLLDQASEQIRTLESGNETSSAIVSEESVGAPESTEAQEQPANPTAGSAEGESAPAEKEDFFAAKEQPKSEGGPATTSFIEQYSHLLEEDGSTEVEPVPERANPLAEEHSPAETVPGDEDEDEALQAYMANMMSRVRGDGPVSAPSTPTPTFTTTPKKVEQTAKEEEYEAPVDPIGLDELRQTTKKAPLTSDLAALRDLANTSARKAIAKSSKRRHFEMAISKLIICGISLPTAGYLMYAAKSYTGVMFLGGAVAAIAGLYSGVQLLGCLLRAIRDGSWEGTDTAAGGADRNVELPISGEASQQA